MAETGTADIDLRRGFGRAGTTLFWSSAAVVMALWGAQRAGTVSLGAWMTPISFTLLFAGFLASSLMRMVGFALYAVTRSTLAREGASEVSRRVADLGFLPRLILNFLPGANLLTIADLIASVHDGSFARGMRAFYQTLAVILGGALAGVGAASAGWRWWQGAPLVSLHGWLLLAAIGVGLAVLLMLASNWVAAGFQSRRPS
jgi:hypothetical protein